MRGSIVHAAAHVSLFYVAALLEQWAIEFSVPNSRQPSMADIEGQLGVLVCGSHRDLLSYSFELSRRVCLRQEFSVGRIPLVCCGAARWRGDEQQQRSDGGSTTLPEATRLAHVISRLSSESRALVSEQARACTL